MTNERQLGFDLARAYAIFGMFIVNFKFCFGSFAEPSSLGFFTNLFVGKSTSIFIICAGMGVVFMSQKAGEDVTQRKQIRNILLKRSWFLFVVGLLLYNWWPGDILHFYAAYLHIAAFVLFVPKRYYLWMAALAVVVYYILQQFIPVTTSWNMETTQYADFWTPIGFLRNSFYNGWNAVFPWFAFFSIGMFLGHLNWKSRLVQRNMFAVGFVLLGFFEALRMFVRADVQHPERNDFYVRNWSHLMTDYFPVNIPFMAIATGFALMVISICMFVGSKYGQSKLLGLLAKTGQMTLTHYISHITLGMVLFSLLTSKDYTSFVVQGAFISSGIILFYSFLYFGISVVFTHFWLKKFQKGPLEMAMRAFLR